METQFRATKATLDAAQAEIVKKDGQIAALKEEVRLHLTTIKEGEEKIRADEIIRFAVLKYIVLDL